MEISYQFEKEWAEDSEIEWRNQGRGQLNRVIRKYNEWQIEGFEWNQIPKILAIIEWGRQTFGKTDGGSGWLEVLDRMKEFVENRRRRNS